MQYSLIKFNCANVVVAPPNENSCVSAISAIPLNLLSPIAEVKGRGRSAFAARDFSAGDFVCEYASCISPRRTIGAKTEMTHWGSRVTALMPHFKARW